MLFILSPAKSLNTKGQAVNSQRLDASHEPPFVKGKTQTLVRQGSLFLLSSSIRVRLESNDEYRHLSGSPVGALQMHLRLLYSLRVVHMFHMNEGGNLQSNERKPAEKGNEHQ